MDDPMLTMREAAELLHLTTSTLRLWRKENRGPESFMLQGRVRYFRSGLDAWVLAQHDASVRGGVHAPAA